MNDCKNGISTRSASDLLGVHESSIKRWCNASNIHCSLTPGGHRRIAISSLLTYAREHGIRSPLHDFDSDAEAVWAGTVDAMRSQDFTSLGQLTLKWLNEGKSRLLDALLRFLSERGLPDPLVFDHLLQLVLGSIGSSYATGSLSIGDEHYMAHAIRDSLIRYCPASANCTPSLQSPIALVGCARGVSHELGAIMVRHLLTVSGWRVVYLGPDVPTEEYSLQQLKHGASLVCISLVQPISLSEVKAIKMLLDQMYNPSCPYALAFGGSSINNEDVLEHIRQTPSRIENMRCFSSLEPFDAWSRSILAS